MSRDAEIVQRLQALAEITRLGIVRRLASGERCVCDLQSDLGASQSRLSFHLKKLKAAGLIVDRPEGRWVYYRLAPGVLDDVRGILGALSHEVDEWDHNTGSCCGGDEC
jgi:ArsR family transcriptional regulator